MRKRLIGRWTISILTAWSLILVAAAPAGAGLEPAPSPGSTSHPSTLPIPGHLLFTRTTGNDVQTIFMATGRTERAITEPGAYCCLVRVAPDRHRILVMPGGDIEPPFTGGTINLHGEQFHRIPLTDPTLNLIPQAWSPSGARIAFEGWDFSDPTRTGIYTARTSDGGGLTRVTTRPGLSHDIPLDYSPDGRRLVFYRSVGVDPDQFVGGSLWTVRVDGSDAREIADASVGPADWARWSRDGKRILFANQRTAPSGAMWTVGPDGSNLRQIYADPNGQFPLDPVWSPDGSQILFALDPTNDPFHHPPNSLYVIHSDGSRPSLVIGTPDFKSQPEWLP